MRRSYRVGDLVQYTFRANWKGVVIEILPHTNSSGYLCIVVPMITGTGKGMDEGFLYCYETYKEQSDFVKVLRGDIPSFNADINLGLSKYEGEDYLADGTIPKTVSDEDLIKFSYDNEYHYWTTWYQDDFNLEEEGEAYDENGNLYTFNGVEWEMDVIEEDYEYFDSSSDLEYEIWKHKDKDEYIKVPVVLERYFNEAKPHKL